MSCYRVWRRLFLTTFATAILLGTGCNEDHARDEAEEFPHPEVITVEELTQLLEPSTRMRLTVIGVLRRDQDRNDYILEPNGSSGSQDSIHSIRLRFDDTPADARLMRRCLGKSTHVTGYLHADKAIQVEYVFLEADVLGQASGYCHQESD